MNSGVQIVQVGDLIQTKNDKSKQLQSGEYLPLGMLPIVDQSVRLICGYTNDLSKSYDKGLPVIVFGDHTLHTKYIDFNFAIGADGVQVLVPKSKACDTRYLYYVISRAAELIGSEGYKRHFKILKEFHVDYIDSPAEQQKIAAILSSVDDVIDKTRAQIDKLKDLKTGMMQELLTKGIGHTEFKNSPVGRIPQSWNVAELKDIASVKGGKRMPKGRPFADHVTPYPYIRVSDFDNGTIRTDGLRYVLPEDQKHIKKYTIGENDLYISIAGTLGLVGSVPEVLDGAQLTENAAKIVFKDLGAVCPEYVKYTLASGPVQAQLNQEKGVGGGVPKLALFRIETIMMPLPPFSEQKAIATSLATVDKRISHVTEKLSAIQSLKKGLMQDLLTGKVRVQLNNNETTAAPTQNADTPEEQQYDHA